MSGSGKGVLGMVRISQNEVGAGTFPDKFMESSTLTEQYSAPMQTREIQPWITLVSYKPTEIF